MTIQLRIPQQYEKGYAKIDSLSDEAVQELLEALKNIPGTFNESRLSVAVAQMVNIPDSDVEEIVAALLSLYSYRDYSQAAVSEVAEGIAQAMLGIESQSLRLSPDDFQNRLAALLDIELLETAVRAAVLSSENQHSMMDTRVITDVRPVFDTQNPESAPTGAVILHTLKINYQGDSGPKDFFVTLDASDVRRLSDQLERATSKAKSLKSLLKTTEVRYIDPE